MDLKVLERLPAFTYLCESLLFSYMLTKNQTANSESAKLKKNVLSKLFKEKRANNVGSDEVAQYEPSHLDLH